MALCTLCRTNVLISHQERGVSAPLCRSQGSRPGCCCCSGCRTKTACTHSYSSSELTCVAPSVHLTNNNSGEEEDRKTKTVTLFNPNYCLHTECCIFLLSSLPALFMLVLLISPIFCYITIILSTSFYNTALIQAC